MESIWGWLMADDLIEIGIKVNSNAEAAYRGLNTLNGAVVNSIKAAERLEKNYALLDKAVNKGKITLEQYAKGVQQTDSAIKSLQQRMNSSVGAVESYGKHVNQARGYTNRLGVVTQQAGYQVGDFFVQLQGGTNGFVALGQQATQLVGTFAMLSQSTKAIGAAPIGSPGCPDLDFSMASTAKKRIELIQSSWMDWVATAIISYC